MKEFYELGQLDLDAIEELLERSNRFEKKGSDPELYRGKVLGALFMTPSLRTLASFQASMSRLGGSTFVISPEMSIHGLETQGGIAMDGRAAEHVREAVPSIASYADIIGIRAAATGHRREEYLNDAKFEEIRSLCDKPVINMESAIHHPCQSLADWKTLDDESIPGKNGKLVLTWVHHPEPQSLSVPGDTLHMAAMRGMDVTVLRPDGFALPEQIMARARNAALDSGGSITETNDHVEALRGADVVYARSWMSTLPDDQLQEARNSGAESGDWCVNLDWFQKANDSCKFMHCLPARRGVEVEDEVLDSDLSIVTAQARNRMFTQMAVIEKILS